MLRIAWDWWYPAGCIKADSHETDEFKAAPYDGEDAAAEIVQRYINENGADGSNNFEIEIFDPPQYAGVYDIELEWEPSTIATKRKAAVVQPVI